MLSYIGKYPNIYGPSIEVGQHENRVTLRKKTTSEKLEIACVGREAFEVTINGLAQGQANKNGMTDAVLGWLKKPNVTHGQLQKLATGPFWLGNPRNAWIQPSSKRELKPPLLLYDFRVQRAVLALFYLVRNRDQPDALRRLAPDCCEAAYQVGFTVGLCFAR